MTTQSQPVQPETQRSRSVVQHGASEAVYGLGFIGALIYYIGQAPTFWIGVLGVLKAIVWPAILVFEALKILN